MNHVATVLESPDGGLSCLDNETSSHLFGGRALGSGTGTLGSEQVKQDVNNGETGLEYQSNKKYYIYQEDSLFSTERISFIHYRCYQSFKLLKLLN